MARLWESHGVLWDAAVVRALFALSCLLVMVGCRPALPQSIQDEMAATPRGQATVVFFTDFQCPFCRRTHAALDPLVAERKGRVRVVLKHVPLRQHPDARTAARASICVEQISPDVAAAYASALMHANDLSEQACAEIAVQHRVDRALFDRCTHDSTTEERIARDGAMFEALEGDGVPLLYVGRSRLDGAQTRSGLEPALDAALESEK
jgi:predicted DsbA family dithiol-disulfide isomerase